MANNTEKNQISNEVRARFGGVQTAVVNEPIKETIMSYSDGQIYIALKKVSTFDPVNNTYRSPRPKITSSFGGHFIEMGISGKRMRDLADFFDKLAQALEGVEISSVTVNDDVDSAKKFMAEFKGQ